MNAKTDSLQRVRLKDGRDATLIGKNHIVYFEEGPQKGNYETVPDNEIDWNFKEEDVQEVR